MLEIVWERLIGLWWEPFEYLDRHLKPGQKKYRQLKGKCAHMMYCEIWQNQQFLISISNPTTSEHQTFCASPSPCKMAQPVESLLQGQVSVVSTLMEIGVYLHLQIAFFKCSYRKRGGRITCNSVLWLLSFSLTFQIQEWFEELFKGLPACCPFSNLASLYLHVRIRVPLGCESKTGLYAWVLN